MEGSAAAEAGVAGEEAGVFAAGESEFWAFTKKGSASKRKKPGRRRNISGLFFDEFPVDDLHQLILIVLADRDLMFVDRDLVTGQRLYFFYANDIRFLDPQEFSRRELLFQGAHGGQGHEFGPGRMNETIVLGGFDEQDLLVKDLFIPVIAFD